VDVQRAPVQPGAGRREVRANFGSRRKGQESRKDGRAES
jgi:hypothetical protein